jgi:hypothetical protein
MYYATFGHGAEAEWRRHLQQPGRGKFYWEGPIKVTEDSFHEIGTLP